MSRCGVTDKAFLVDRRFVFWRVISMNYFQVQIIRKTHGGRKHRERTSTCSFYILCVFALLSSEAPMADFYKTRTFASVQI